MMKDNFEAIFKSNKSKFDFAEPNIGHFDRFEKKLKAQKFSTKKGIKTKWYWLATAASVILFFGYWMGNQNVSNHIELADVSPKMEETQHFYLASIHKEIELIKKEQTPENKLIIEDAFSQLKILESNYKTLTLELKESNEDKRVIYAMIKNFQIRLSVLQNLLDQLEDFKKYEKLNSKEKSV